LKKKNRKFGIAPPSPLIFAFDAGQFPI